MRGFFSKPPTKVERVLVIESEPRHATDQILEFLYATEANCSVDVLTCYETKPVAFDEGRGKLLSIHDRSLGRSRKQIIQRFAGSDYSVIALPLPGSHVLRKWRLMIALRTKAYILIGDAHQRFWYLRSQVLLDRSADSLFGGPTAMLRAIGTRIASKAGLVAELIIAPFSLSVLALYAVSIHARRFVRVRRLRAQTKKPSHIVRSP